MSYVALDIFQQLRQEDIHWILASAELKTVLANSVLVREDDPCETIFFVADGLLEVYFFAGPTNQVKIGQLGPGEVIGEISWLGRRPVSASVRAVETSSVIALSTAVLERKLAEDPRFAARFLRGVATLTVERLRKTTSQVRRSELAAAPRPTATSGAESSSVLHKISEFKTLVAAADKRAIENNGTIPDDYAQQIREMFAAIERGTGPQGMKNAAGIAEVLQAELLPFIQLTATGDRYYSKPRGYAGDYQTIEMIYNNTPAGVGRVGPLLDSCMLNLAAAKAIRNRRRLLATEILSSFRAAEKELHVASLACGPAREVFDVFERADDSERLHVSCVDIDREALAHVGARCEKEKLSDRVRTFHGNLIYLATGRQQLDLAPQDLIYSIGLVDSFSDELVIELINWIYDKLRPGGRVILGNFHPRNPTRGLMDHVLDWRLTYREEGDMDRLYTSSKFGRPSSRIVFEEEGVNLFAECRKE
jgi:CRP-like cAMP-binding protein/SAM-dependent methyltransferase